MFFYRKRFFSTHCELAKSTKALATKEKPFVIESMTQVMHAMSKAREMKNRHLSFKIGESFKAQMK